jgi:spore maturation protein SpmA
LKDKASPINIIWFSIILISVITASYTGKMAEISKASFESAKSAVELAIGLIGAMALWLGIMKIIEVAGAMKLIANLIKPIMKKLFPETPAHHPAMSAMIMNISANALGLGNAATPMGIKAMQELDKLNKEKGTATDAMCLFLAINTSSVTILPLGIITLRAASGETNPASILPTTLFATIISTTVAIIFSKIFAKKYPLNTMKATSNKEKTAQIEEQIIRTSIWGKIFILISTLLFLGGITYSVSKSTVPITFSTIVFAMSNWLIPVLMVIFLIYGYLKGVKLYETLIEGAKEGFDVAIKIIPFMVAIFVAIGMFRASGAMQIFSQILSPITNIIGMPSEALSVALLRPLSGSGSFGLVGEIVKTHPNTFLSYLVSTMQGSTETTFYVLAVYFGAIGIKNSRYAVLVALLADFFGIISSLFICKLFW